MHRLKMAPQIIRAAKDIVTALGMDLRGIVHKGQTRIRTPERLGGRRQLLIRLLLVSVSGNIVQVKVKAVFLGFVRRGL